VVEELQQQDSLEEQRGKTQTGQFLTGGMPQELVVAVIKTHTAQDKAETVFQEERLQAQEPVMVGQVAEVALVLQVVTAYGDLPAEPV
jgi:hypothetical protein